MDKEKLCQANDLKKEIKLIQKQIENSEYLVDINMTTDSVRGSSNEFPYTQHAIKIHGVDIQDYEKKLRALKKQLQRRLGELMDKVAEINRYIETVEDSKTRMILQCKFVNGLTWEAIADELGMNIRTIHRKFSKWRNKKS